MRCQAKAGAGIAFVLASFLALAHPPPTGSGPADTGDAIGTPPYMAPEQHMGHTSPLSDVYSLGVVAYEIAAGRAPFIGPLYVDERLKERYQPLGPEVPSPLREVIVECLRADEAARPKGMRAVLSMLRGGAPFPS